MRQALTQVELVALRESRNVSILEQWQPELESADMHVTYMYRSVGLHEDEWKLEFGGEDGNPDPRYTRGVTRVWYKSADERTLMERELQAGTTCVEDVVPDGTRFTIVCRVDRSEIVGPPHHRIHYDIYHEPNPPVEKPKPIKRHHRRLHSKEGGAVIVSNSR